MTDAKFMLDLLKRDREAIVNSPYTEEGKQYYLAKLDALEALAKVATGFVSGENPNCDCKQCQINKALRKFRAAMEEK